ncbi:hypothetical protein CC205_20065 [Pseudomonas savastanoi pv. nerii]|uniref:DUF1534 domain-containing protein n=1 Tax=Pseudomonas savastanoi pv. nerii TaxID=360921 RepID=A0AB73S0A3_PSESS|nr:hypothetical protein CC205_20065 [Pseudomonas savastanoi pv. nerii]
MRLSFLTLQRRNAVREARRHRSLPHRTFKIGRKSGTTNRSEASAR